MVAETAPSNSLIIAVDLAPIKTIPRTICVQDDITSDKCRAFIRGHLKGWKVDTVLHDGAPNVGAAWVQDAYSQAELVLQALKLAADFLAPEGTFVTKVFRSKDYNALLWVFNQLFTKVEATKPPASRTVSAEIFVVCRGFKAPKQLDPRFVDPRTVFAELSDPTPNHEAKVFNPDRKKRKREGYAEGDYTQFSQAPAIDFIQTTDPISILGSLNRLTFDPSDAARWELGALDALPETTAEIKEYCLDLKLLGRKEFRCLLRWRIRARETLGLSTRKPRETEPESQDAQGSEPVTEEALVNADWERMRQREAARRKKERRKENERKQREIYRMQMNMLPPTEIGLEQSSLGGKALSSSLLLGPQLESTLEDHGIDMELPPSDSDRAESGSDGEPESGDEIDRLDEELDFLYTQYQHRKQELDKAQRARIEARDHSTSNRDANGAPGGRSAHEEEVTDEQSTTQAPNLSSRAMQFFGREEFGGLSVLDDVDDSESEAESGHVSYPRDSTKRGLKNNVPERNSALQAPEPSKIKSSLAHRRDRDARGDKGIQTDDADHSSKPLRKSKKSEDLGEHFILPRQDRTDSEHRYRACNN